MTRVLRNELGDPLELRGLAVPFRERVTYEGRSKHFEATAFAHADAGLASAPIRWDHADNELLLLSAASDVTWTQTVRGLFFATCIPTSCLFAWPLVDLARRGELACSVSTLEPETADDGAVVVARLEHVAIAMVGTTVFPTCVWIEDSSERYPRLPAPTAEWRRHLEAHLSHG